MNAADERIAAKPQRALSGKVIGVIRNRWQLTSLRDSLATLGVRSLQVLDGVAGIPRLEAWQETIAKHFFDDMECKMLQRYLNAVESGQIVFAADVHPETAEKAAEIAKKHGSSEVVHFGNPVAANLLTSVLLLT